MKNLIISVILLSSLSNFAQGRAENDGERVLKGSKVYWDFCEMQAGRGHVADSAVITLLQNKNLFIRIMPGNGYFIPEVVTLRSDSKGMSKSNQVNYGSDCWGVQRCIDQFGSDELGVVSRCSENGEFSVEFYGR